jgi:hypothetical protein
MTKSIDYLIQQFKALEPTWNFLLRDGGEYVRREDGSYECVQGKADCLCHLTAPDFDEDREQSHIAVYAPTAFEAFDKALELLIERKGR